MRKILYSIVVIFLVGCTSDNKEIYLDSFADFITNVEQNNSSYSSDEWEIMSDSLAFYIKKKTEFRLTPEEIKEIDENVIIFNKFKGSFKESPLNINFYLDNSGSTNGYLKRGNFKPVISKLLNHFPPNTNIKLSYSNSEVLSFDGTVDAFVENLTPQGIKKGNTGESNLNNIFKSVLNEIDDNTVSIMVGDGIYSIGGTSDIITDLRTKKESTSGKFIEVLSHKENIETVVVKLIANYEGTYYDYKNGTHAFNDNRPYYIWFFGTTKNINKVLDAVNIEETDGYKNTAHYYVINKREIQYSILNGAIGSFNNDKNIPYGINNIEMETRGDLRGFFGLSVAINLNNLPLNETYITNILNYKANNFLVDSIVKIPQELFNSDINISSIVKYEKYKPSHLIYMSSNSINYGTLNIELLNNDFKWINESSNEDDTYPDNYTTFGFKYLMKGVSDAYRQVNGNNNYFSIKIEINN